ncbi:NPP1 domain-containing protein [Colletotrichum costaricense]|uniref:NPP1 domain-containing protein n=1 Tax=Colletotrichum costaricense TaxID=1209916 RepID=A0AAJ0DXU0_9PEZI|nr:NPP1 domain-containing protein [Colletotrichum costaricense]KAK1520772.1 NPP1 domain-containing protein [Colletotrichum costaricense]
MIRHALTLLLLSTTITGQVTSPDSPYNPESQDDGDALAERAVNPGIKPLPSVKPAPGSKPAPSVVPPRNQTSSHIPSTFSKSIRITTSSHWSSYAPSSSRKPTWSPLPSSTRKPSQLPSSTWHSSALKPSSTPAPIHVSNGETVAAAVGAVIIGGILGGFVMAPSGALLPIAAGQTAVLSAAAGSGAAGSMPEFELDPVEDKPDLPESVPEVKPTQQKPTEKPTEKPATPTQVPTPSQSYDPETASETYDPWTSSAPWSSSAPPSEFPSSTSAPFSWTSSEPASSLVTTSSVWSTTIATSTSSAAPTSTVLNWIDHDKVAALNEATSLGLEGQLQLRFNPELFVSGGCDPYPAVDAFGSLGAGLRPTGGGRSGCGNGGTGQVYVRRGSSQGRTAIMYSYYFPKVRWAKGNDNGHTHYWASIVVWVNRWGCEGDTDVSAVFPVGVSFTRDHTVWDTAQTGDISYLESTHPKMQIHDNAMSPFTGADGDKVFERTLVAWDALPDAAERALSLVEYEKTQVPFIDANFQTYLDAAYKESFYGALTDQQGCGGTN